MFEIIAMVIILVMCFCERSKKSKTHKQDNSSSKRSCSPSCELEFKYNPWYGGVSMRKGSSDKRFYTALSVAYIVGFLAIFSPVIFWSWLFASAMEQSVNYFFVLVRSCSSIVGPRCVVALSTLFVLPS